MEILIKGMDMPETCIDCPLHDGEYGQCNINHNIYISLDDRPRKCPLTEINSHYLIDTNLPSAQPEIIRCNDCMHNGSFDTDCPIDWAGKDYCNFAERRTDDKQGCN